MLLQRINMVAPTDKFMHGLENIKRKESKDYMIDEVRTCLLYTSDAADDEVGV